MFLSFDIKNWQNPQNFIKIWPWKTVLFRNKALIFSLEKQCFLENSCTRFLIQQVLLANSDASCTTISAFPVSQMALQHIKFPQCILVNAWLKKGGHWRTVLSFFSIKVCTVVNSKWDLDLEQKLGPFFKKSYVLIWKFFYNMAHCFHEW